MQDNVSHQNNFPIKWSELFGLVKLVHTDVGVEKTTGGAQVLVYALFAPHTKPQVG